MKYLDFLGLTSFKFFSPIKGNSINNCESFKVHKFCLGEHCDYLLLSKNTCLYVMYFDPALFDCILLGHDLKVLLTAFWSYLLAKLQCVSVAILSLSSYFCGMLD
jgi:hypothetical protein